MPGDEVTEDIPWLSSEQLEDWVALMALLAVLPPALDSQLKRDAGLNLFEYQILVQLGEAPKGAVPMTELAQLAQGSPSRISHAVTRLEKAGFVQRVECREADFRTAAVLTEAGRAKLEASAPGHVLEARRLVIDALTPEQLKRLGDAARTVAKTVDPDYFAAIGW